MRDLGAVLDHEEPLPHRSEDQEQCEIPARYDLDVASSKWRDIGRLPKEGNHEPNRSSFST